MQMASVTASLLGTASYSSYGLTASYGLNVGGTWNSSSYTSPTQSVAGFGFDGKAILYTPTQDNVYLAKRGNNISWVPIETKFSAVYVIDEQQGIDLVSQSINYGFGFSSDITEEVQSATSKLKELTRMVDKEVIDFQQIAISLSGSVITAFISGESLDRQDTVINKTGLISSPNFVFEISEFAHLFTNLTGSMVFSNITTETMEYGYLFTNKTGSMVSSNVFFETMEFGHFFTNKTGSMVSSNVFVETMEHGHFFTNKTGSMMSSNIITDTMEYGYFFTNKTGSMVSSTQLAETIEYVDSIIYITGSMQPIFTATPFTTASI
jgi:Periplasmic copper-binding protein (NosD)